MKETVYTIGFQQSERPSKNYVFEDFMARMKDWKINRLVDIRRHNNANVYPKNPWCKTNLVGLLNERDIEYTELKEVAPSAKLLIKEKYGIPTELCDCRSIKTCFKEKIHARRPFTIDEFNVEYLKELEKSGGVQALRDLLNQHHEERLALMCWEADPNKCHRRMLTDAIIAQYPEEYAAQDINESEREAGHT